MAGLFDLICFRVFYLGCVIGVFSVLIIFVVYWVLPVSITFVVFWVLPVRRFLSLNLTVDGRMDSLFLAR